MYLVTSLSTSMTLNWPLVFHVRPQIFNNDNTVQVLFERRIPSNALPWTHAFVISQTLEVAFTEAIKLYVANEVKRK